MTNPDIAIIGINGYFPQAPDIATFWQNLVDGKCSVTDIPSDRWEVNAFFDADGQADKSYCRRGGFIDNVYRFDASFFHISTK